MPLGTRLTLTIVGGLLLACASALPAQGHAAKAAATRTAAAPSNPRPGAGPGSRPPGWDHGKKTGWKGGRVPPGQAKKSVRARGTKSRSAPFLARPDGRPAQPGAAARRRP